jgi:hypothetical protein
MLEKKQCVFLGGKILHKGLGTKDFFGGKKAAKLPYFGGKKKPKITIFRQYILENIARSLKKTYFTISPLTTKFGSFLLCMIESPPTS